MVSFGGSSSQQKSRSGVPKGLRRQAATEGLELLGGIQPLIEEFRLATPSLNLNSRGLTAGTQNLFDDALDQALTSNVNRFSSNLALRGLGRPENIATLIDQSARQAQREVLPTFAPIAAQNEFAESQFESTQLSNTIQLLQQLGALFQSFTQGGEGSGSSSGTSFSFNPIPQSVTFGGSGGKQTI